MTDDAQPIEIKVSQGKPRTTTPRAPKRVVNIRPAVTLAANAAVAGGSTLFAVAGIRGLVMGGVGTVVTTAAAVAKGRKEAKKQAAEAARRAATPAERRAAATKRAAAGGGGTSSGRISSGRSSSGVKGALDRAAKSGGVKGTLAKVARGAGAALGSPKRAASLGRAAAAKSTSPRQAAAAAKRRAQVGAALAGKKSSKMRGTGAALMGGVSGARQAWKKSGEEMKKKRAAEAKKKAQAAKAQGKGKPAKKVGKEIRKNPNAAPKATPATNVTTKNTPVVAPVELPPIPLPGANAPAPLATGGNAMSYSPMRAMLQLAEEMTKAAQRWNPVQDKVGMRQVAREFEIWPEVIKEFAKACQVVSDKTTDPRDGVPLNPLILSVIDSVHRNQTKSVASAAEEVPGLIRSLHRKQFEVLEETPHHANNDMWGYSANKEAV